MVSWQLFFLPNIFYGQYIFLAQIFLVKFFLAKFSSANFFFRPVFFLKNLFFFEFTLSTVFACHNMFVQSGVWAKKVFSTQKYKYRRGKI